MSNLAILIDVLLKLLDKAGAIGSLIGKAKAENRDVTDAELDQLAAGDDVAKKTLQDAIDRARAGG